jgi:signal transduction histidine kinase
MSLRLRLTLLYAAILALVVMVFSVAVYASQARLSYDALRADLDEIGRGIMAQDEAGPLAVPEAFDSGETLVLIRGLDGAVLDRSDQLNGRDLPLPENALSEVRAGRAWHETAEHGGETLLVSTQLAERDGAGIGIVQVARPTAARSRALRTLAATVIVGAGAASLLALGAGWLSAGLALLPINRLTKIAQEIGARRDFSRRVEYTGPDDEIGRLAATFNGMLAELQAAQLELEQNLQHQRRFLADVSHELRTPLTSLRGNLDLLRREPPIPEADRSDILDDMAAETQRLIRLVNDLLNVARADARREMQPEPVRVRGLMDDLGRQARVLEPERAITWEAPEGLLALADPDALRQVLLILLDNALKHSPPTAAVRMSGAPDDGRVILQVHDTGPGIEPAAMPHLFDRFYRGKRARAAPGAGLGLPIAKMLVEAQRGALTVHSGAGEGTTFTVTLPGTSAEIEDEARGL